MRFAFYTIITFLLLLVIAKADGATVTPVACQAITPWNYSGNASLDESQLNKVTTCLESVLAEIDVLRKQGYDTGSIEAMFDDANSLLTEAKNSYFNKDYNSVNSKISSVLDSVNKISYEIEKLNVTSVQTPQSVPSQPTGLMIVDYSWVSYLVGAVVVIAAIVILKVGRKKKELRGISKLVRIKSRLEQ